MNKKWINVGLAASVLATVALTGCSSSSDNKDQGSTSNGSNTASPQEINLYDTDDLTTLDVSKTNSTISANGIGQVYEGLVHLDKTGNPAPGMAKTWDVSPDGLTYTFHLQDSKWTNGDPVTAKDFVYSWKRTLDPKTKSEYAFMVEWIKGGQAYNEGKGTADDVAVKAVDDKTLQVTLEQPRPYFLSSMSFPTWYPLNQKAVEQFGDKYGTDADKVVTNGPFKVTSWQHDSNWTFEKNENYWDAKNVKLTKATYQVVKDSNALANLYEAGQLDRISLTRDQVETYKDSKELQRYTAAGSYYLTFNVKKQPALANKKIRQALSYAIDRQQMVDVVYNDGSVPAKSLTPVKTSDGLGGDYTTPLGDLIKEKDNASKAKQLLEEGLKEAGLSSFPKLKFTNTDTSSSKKMDEFIKEQWRQKLGIDIEIEEVPFKLKVQKQYGHDFDIVFAGWNPDYDDAMTYLDMFVTNGPSNDGQYSNPAYDDLIKKANAETDAKKRQDLMHQAEKLLMEDLPVSPLFWPGATVLQKSYVKDWVIRKSSPKTDLKFVHIEGK